MPIYAVTMKPVCLPKSTAVEYGQVYTMRVVAHDRLDAATRARNEVSLTPFAHYAITNITEEA
jgi:hypothetical protein